MTTRIVALLISCAAIVALSTTAFAEPAPAPAPAAAAAAAPNEEGGIQEIVVTAEKRAENLEQVPDAVTAITSKQRDLIGIETFQDITKGNFVLTQHWSQTTISAYQLYNYWLNSSEIGTSAGNFERLKNKTVNGELAKLAAQTTVKGQLKYLAPVENYVATNLPVIPTVYGAAFDEYNSSGFTGWPSSSTAW